MYFTSPLNRYRSENIMNVFMELIENKVLIFAGLSWIIAQIIKIVIALVTEKRFRPDRIFGDGGMPSGHSATVTSLAVLVGWTQGYNSVLFAIAMILAIIVMNDASGVRLEAGKHAASIKELADIVNGLFNEKDKEVKTEKLKLLVGHTPLQVFCGALLGIVVSICCILIFDLPHPVF